MRHGPDASAQKLLRPSRSAALLSRLPLPREHGAYLTLAGAASLGVVQARDRIAAAGAALALAATFFARGPLEARGGVRGIGVGVLACCAVLALGGVAVAHARAPSVVGLAITGPFVLLLSAAVARRTHQTRAAPFVLMSMAALGGSGGAIAWIGGVPGPRAAMLGAVVGVHALASVAVLRAELRPAERDRLPSRARLSAAGVAATAAALSLSNPLAGAALMPRLAISLIAPYQQRCRPAALGLRETLALAACVAIACAIP